MKTVENIDEVIKTINENKMVFLYISTNNCGVCKVLYPKLQSMLSKFPEIINLSIEIEKVKEVASHFSVFTAPMLLLLIDGKETIRESRFVNIKDLEDKINRYYSIFYEILGYV